VEAAGLNPQASELNEKTGRVAASGRFCFSPLPRKQQQKAALQDAFIVIRNKRHQGLIAMARNGNALPILRRQRRVIQG
jgi:hypothetical protein